MPSIVYEQFPWKELLNAEGDDSETIKLKMRYVQALREVRAKR